MTMTAPRLALMALGLAALAAACTELPPVETTVSAAGRAAPYPDLAPTAALTSGLPQPRIAESDPAALQSSGDRLRRDAVALRARPTDG
ncbi:hypothetical protein [Pseudooceanicola sp. LIPI14-2-Ac024]|uniref:hypothetical protein n=1 Tax=Pseudooceanicola sp. LIPI14-2-Ac024 TaxID=3344875 RepID=UPI0035CF7B9F